MCERGAILIVPFPFSDLSATKRRPILALTRTDDYGDFIALPITSRPQTEHGLPITSADMMIGILPAPSWIRTNRVVTLNDKLVVKSLGQISDATLNTAIDKFCTYIRTPAP